MVALMKIVILLFVVIVAVNAAIYDPDAPKPKPRIKGHCENHECRKKMKCEQGKRAYCKHSICTCPKVRHLLGHCDETECARDTVCKQGTASCQNSLCLCPRVRHLKGHCEEHECAREKVCKGGKRAYCENSVCMCPLVPDIIGGESPDSE